MTPPQRSYTCTEAADLLDLYAADACDADQAEALSAHLADCPTCTASLDESRDLQATLDWTARAPEARERLRAALDAEAKPQRSHGGQPPVWVRRLGSLAALLLVVLGLTLFFGDGQATDSSAFLVTEIPADSRMMLEMKAPAMGVKDLMEKREPSPVDVPFEVRNAAARPVRLYFQDKETRLRLDLHGPGELRKQPTVVPPELDLPPGQTGQFTLHGLAVTKPGNYQLHGQLRVAAIFAEPSEPERRGIVWLTLPSVLLGLPGE